MRNIWFRGLGKNGIWRYGHYFVVNDVLQSYHYIRENSSDHRIDPTTLGQFTGLKDKNGIECYEGDKVTNSLTAHHGQVVFSDEYACFNVMDINGRLVCSMGAMHSDGFEITGNIYEDKGIKK